MKKLKVLYATRHRTASEAQGPALLKGGDLGASDKETFWPSGDAAEAQAWISAGAEVVPAVWMGLLATSSCCTGVLR